MTRPEGQGECAEGEEDGVKRAAAQTLPAKVGSRRRGKKGIAEIRSSSTLLELGKKEQ